MSPSDVAAIIVRLDHLREDVLEVKAQVKETNGRVTALERVNIKQEAVAEASVERKRGRAWLPSTVTAFVIFALGASVERFVA